MRAILPAFIAAALALPTERSLDHQSTAAHGVGGSARGVTHPRTRHGGHGRDARLSKGALLIRSRADTPGGEGSYDGAATGAAKRAEQVVVFLGTDNSVETEGTDRQSLGLPGAQEALLAAVRAAAAPTSTAPPTAPHGRRRYSPVSLPR